MLEEAASRLIRNHLYRRPQTSVYAILDGASVPELPQVLWEKEPEHVCLYRGKLEPDMAEVAPYLVKLEYESEFTDWVIGDGWGNHWGIFAVTPAEVNLRMMRQHLRKYLMVLDPEGERMYFRYYDPRVLEVYLPTCTPEEMEMLFGPVDCFILEEEDKPVMLTMSLKDGRLIREETPVSQAAVG